GTEADPKVLAAQPAASKWLRYQRFRSPALSKFWGRDMYLGAWVLLPNGYDQHPNARYPLIVYQDHYHPGIGPLPFVTSPPNPKSPNARREQAGYRFYQAWTSAHFPRVLLLYIQDANPYYDDSYAVDSANLGPYGTAINNELIPAIEKQYRGIGQGWARATFGGSTGGWRAFATQVFYPDLYNGVWVACPDPVDFHGYQNVDLYTDTNAFHRTGPFATIPIAETASPTAPSSPRCAVSTPSNTSSEPMAAPPNSGPHGRPSSPLLAATDTPRKSSTHSPAISTRKSWITGTSTTTSPPSSNETGPPSAPNSRASSTSP